MLFLPFFYQQSSFSKGLMACIIICQNEWVYPERTRSSSQSPMLEICLHPNNLEVRVNKCQFCINDVSGSFFLAEHLIPWKEDFVQNDQILWWGMNTFTFQSTNIFLEEINYCHDDMTANNLCCFLWLDNILLVGMQRGNYCPWWPTMDNLELVGLFCRKFPCFLVYFYRPKDCGVPKSPSPVLACTTPPTLYICPPPPPPPPSLFITMAIQKGLAPFT